MEIRPFLSDIPFVLVVRFNNPYSLSLLTFFCPNNRINYFSDVWSCHTIILHFVQHYRYLGVANTVCHPQTIIHNREQQINYTHYHWFFSHAPISVFVCSLILAAVPVHISILDHHLSTANACSCLRCTTMSSVHKRSHTLNMWDGWQCWALGGF